MVGIRQFEFQFPFLGAQDDGLAFHAPDHVERSFGFSAQRHLQQVLFDTGFDGLAQLRGDLKVTIRRAKAFDALMRPFMIIVLDPEPNALPRRVETLELSAGKELLPDRFPKPLDLAERHGMMRPGFEVVRAVLFHLRLETGRAAPIDILPAVVGEHLFGRLILRGGNPEDLQHVLCRVTAEQIGAHHEARVIIHEPDKISVASSQSEGEDVGLPHLVGSGSLKETGPHQIALWLGRRLHQSLLLERSPNRLRTGFQKENPPQQVRDSFDPTRGFFLFEFEDFLPNRFGQLPGLTRAG